MIFYAHYYHQLPASGNATAHSMHAFQSEEVHPSIGENQLGTINSNKLAIIVFATNNLRNHV